MKGSGRSSEGQKEKGKGEQQQVARHMQMDQASRFTIASKP